MGSLEIVRIVEIVREASHTLTYRFPATFGGEAGQFVMVWIPGHDELPMALSYLGDVKGITVQAMGDATRAFASFKVGDRIGVRGPYGNAFQVRGTSCLFVGGGTGAASLIAAIEAYAAAGKEVTTVLAAKTKSELIFEKRAGDSGRVEVSTDDGSKGFKGFATPLADKLLDEEGFDQIVTCGPEKMMFGIVQSAMRRGIEVQASLERYMKCAVGICDACAFDDDLLCVQGPILEGARLAASRDFGHWRRDRSGVRVPL